MNVLLDPESSEVILRALSRDVRLRSEDVQLELSRVGIYMDTTVIHNACSALNAGFNLLLTGPPGTGKSSLANALATVAFQKGYSNSPLFTTANEAWTTFETIGGYMPDPTKERNGLRFEEGLFLKAIGENRWLVIDELNRADIDKAIGPLFTVLSGHSTTLPYRNETGNISIGPAGGGEWDYVVSSQWRIISTMNTVDKLSLFRLSYAFQRRFAQVYVGLPEPYDEFVTRLCQPYVNDFAVRLGRFFDSLKSVREIGPAIVRDVARYLSTLGSPPSPNSFTAALDAFVAPQLAGLEPEDVQVIGNLLVEQFSDLVQVDLREAKSTGTLKYAPVSVDRSDRQGEDETATGGSEGDSA